MAHKEAKEEIMPHADRGLATTIEAEEAPCAASTAERIVDFLDAEGIDTAFGVPGGPIMKLFHALSRRKTVRTVLSKHEQGAVFGAYGHARVSGRLGLAVVTSGPGTTNALSALASAYHDHVPLLILSGQVSTTAVGRGAAQDSSAFATDTIAMSRPVTAMSFAAGSPDQALCVLPHLLRLAHARRRPVLLELPIDVLFGTPRARVQSAYRGGPAAPFDRAAADRSLSSMQKASKLAFLVGSGASRVDVGALVALAESLGAAVTTTPKGKGLFPEDHPLSLGVFGFAGSRWAEAALLSFELDTLIVLGSALGELSTNGWSRRLRPAVLIHVDLDAAVLGANYASCGVVGDVGAIVEHWRRATARSPKSARDTAWVAALKGTCSRFANPGALLSNELPMRPERVMAELSACLPPRALVVCDIGNCMAYAIHYLTLAADQRFLLNLGFACMGHAPATALGARLADPSRPVVALMGDAAFAMGGFEVHTAVEYRAARAPCGGPVVVVLNNGGNGMVEAGARAEFGAAHGVDTGMYRHPLSVARIGRGLGAASACVATPSELRCALTAALRPGRGPTVIDVTVAREAVPPMGARIESLARFAKGET